MPHRRILVVEDHAPTRESLVKALQSQGYDVLINITGDGVFQQVANSHPPIDLVLCDVVLPNADGTEIAHCLSREKLCKVILVSSRKSDEDRIKGLARGADDYVVKPLNMVEVLLRVQAVLRRNDVPSHEHDQESIYIHVYPGIRLHKENKLLLHKDGAEFRLTDAENEALLFLIGNAGKVCTRPQLVKITKSQNWSPTDRSIDMLISRLRKKLEANSSHAELLVTIRGKGYMLATQ
ncbi:response regulator transcription factor [Vibrio penaeicida]|uniref:response regulator transcription factor n=1 Tax=Vibrio penaeicida TaxID=104609 RepID=UPI000CE9BBE0|nr:response regulator transcription factor [Vibrio penaeicida]